jgi:CxxC motif-containing protein
VKPRQQPLVASSLANLSASNPVERPVPKKDFSLLSHTVYLLRIYLNAKVKRGDII